MARGKGTSEGHRGHSPKGVAKHGGKHRKKFSKGGVGSTKKNPHAKMTKKGTRAAGMTSRHAGKVK